MNSNHSLRVAHHLTSFLLLATLVAASSGQTRRIGYPTGNTGGNARNFAPLGENCNGNSNRARTHVLIPRNHLPARVAVIFGLEHVPVIGTAACVPGATTVSYQLLEITLAHRSPSAGPLSTTFANNLPNSPPAPVYAVNNTSRQWVVGAWDQITFQQPFVYNGTDDLVIEIRKVVTATNQNVASRRNLTPVRNDLPAPVMRFGNAQSTAESAPTGVSANLLGWRLSFDGDPAPTLEARSTLGPGGSHYEHGQNMHYRLFAPSNDLFVLFAAFAFQPVAIQAFPGAGGIWLLPPVGDLGSGLITPGPGLSYQRVNLNLPNTPSLAGTLLVTQGLTLNAIGLQFSNACSFVIR